MKIGPLLGTLLTMSLFPAHFTSAATRDYDLILEQKPVTIQNKVAEGMTINGSIPGPTLRFSTGDLPESGSRIRWMFHPPSTGMESWFPRRWMVCRI